MTRILTLIVARQMRVSRDEAVDIYEKIEVAMATLPKIMDEYEVTERDRDTLAGIWVHALNPPALSRYVNG